MNYDKSDVGKGLYPKYTVIRNDGRDKPGEMHEGCEYFVIDLTHDPLAVAPLEAYAEKASEAGYHDLARDLRLKEKITAVCRIVPQRNHEACVFRFPSNRLRPAR